MEGRPARRRECGALSTHRRSAEETAADSHRRSNARGALLQARWRRAHSPALRNAEQSSGLPPSADRPQGRLLIFDDSIEHEARNPEGQLRTILIFDVWRPELSDTERQAISAIFHSIDSFQALPDA